MFLLVPAHPGSSRQRVVCVCVCVCVYIMTVGQFVTVLCVLFSA